MEVENAADMGVWVIFCGCNAGGIFGIFSTEEKARQSLAKNIRLIDPGWDDSDPFWNLGWPYPGKQGFLNPEFFEWKLGICVEIYLQRVTVDQLEPHIIF